MLQGRLGPFLHVVAVEHFPQNAPLAHLFNLRIKANAVPVAASSSACVSARPTRPGVRPRSLYGLADTRFFKPRIRICLSLDPSSTPLSARPCSGPRVLASVLDRTPRYSARTSWTPDPALVGPPISYMITPFIVYDPPATLVPTPARLKALCIHAIAA
jgi:hypothetical protein